MGGASSGGVLGSFKILYGDGSYLAELAKRLGDPSFEGARGKLLRR